LIEQPLVLAIAVDLFLHGVPVHQLNRRWHNADKCRSLHGLKSLAASRSRLVFALAELLHSAPRRFDQQYVMPVRYEGTGQQDVAFLKLDADGALADSRQDIDLVDWKVDDVSALAGQENCLLVSDDCGHDDSVAFVELYITPAQFVGSRAKGRQRRP